MKLNETPVRTSRNFKINNINIEDISIPDKFLPFTNIEITSGNKIEENIKMDKLTYGLGKQIEENILKKANSKVGINIKKQDDNVKLVYTLDDNNINLQNYIEIEANNDANIIIEYKSNTKKKCFVSSVIRIISKNNTNVNVAVINLLNQESNYFVAMENNLYDNSDLQYTVIDLGAKNSIQNYYSNIIGKNANNILKSIYLGEGMEIKDINYIAELRGINTNVIIDVQGALKDEAKKNFKGTIDFKNGCKKAKGDENEYCMLLSNEAKSIALPMLLCTEDDVEGNHSTASRQAR